MKFIYVITILLCIYLLFSIFLKLFNSCEGFENKNNSIVFDLYPKLNQLGNYNRLQSSVNSTVILNYDGEKYDSIIPSLKNISTKKMDSIDVTYNDNISGLNKSKLSKLYIINPYDPITNLYDKRKLVDGEYIFVVEGRKNNHDKVKIKYELSMDKSKFDQPYITLQEKNDTIGEDDDSYVVKGEAKGGFDKIHMRPLSTSKLKINLKINNVLEDVKCYMSSSYDHSRITSYTLVKTEKYVNNKLVEGFQNHESESEDSSDEYSSDDYTSDEEEEYSSILDMLPTMPPLFEQNKQEGFKKFKKRFKKFFKRKKKKVEHFYYYEFELDKHYEYDVNFSIIPSIKNSFYEIKNEENMEPDKNVVDSYGYNITENQSDTADEGTSNNLYKWLKNKLSKSNNHYLFSLLKLDSKNNNEEVEVGNLQQQSFSIDSYNNQSNMKTHNIKLIYNFDDSIDLSNSISVLQLEFANNLHLKSFYESMRQIYIGSRYVIHKGSITYSTEYQENDEILNNQVYLLFVRDDLFEPDTVDTWLKERLGVSYHDKDKYLIKGFKYDEESVGENI